MIDFYTTGSALMTSAEAVSKSSPKSGGCDFSQVLSAHTNKLADDRAGVSQTSSPARTEPRTEARREKDIKKDQEPDYEAAAAAAQSAYQQTNQTQNTTGQTDTENDTTEPVTEIDAAAGVEPQTNVRIEGFFIRVLQAMLSNAAQKEEFAALLEQLGIEMPADDQLQSFEDVIAKLLDDLNAQTVTMTLTTGEEVEVTRVTETYKELAALMRTTFAPPEDLVTDAVKPETDSVSLPLLPELTQEENPLPALKQTLQNILQDMRAPVTQTTKAAAPQTETDDSTLLPVEETAQAPAEVIEAEEPAAAPKTEQTAEQDDFSALLGQKDPAPVQRTAPVQAAAQPQPVNQTAVIQQLTQAAQLMKNDGTSSLEIQLHPAHLGKVSILLESGPEGVTAQFKAHNDHVRGMLSAGLAELNASLKDMGINMKNIEVTQSELGWDFTRGSMQDSPREQHDHSQNQAPSSRRAAPLGKAGRNALSQALYGVAQTQPQIVRDNTSVEFIA